MAKKNILTLNEADKLFEKLRKKAEPSKELQEYVHNVLLQDAHYLFQYRIGNRRFGHCTHCKRDFPLEIDSKREIFENDYELLNAKHGELVTCPECWAKVRKRYAKVGPPTVYAHAAEFKVDENGALIVYVYCFTYDYKKDFQLEVPHWNCYQIGYFDIHKYFHILNGWFEDIAYTGDKFTSDLNFTNSEIIQNPFRYDQNRYEGIKCYKLKEAIHSSNLKYCCLFKFVNDDDIFDLFKFLKFYCSYPEITEKLAKEGYEDVLSAYLNGGMKGCFNFNAKTVKDFLKLDKEHIKLFKTFKLKHEENNIKAMQYIQKNNIKFNSDVFSFISNSIIWHKESLDMLLKFVGIKKLMNYVHKQGELCQCRYSYTSNESIFFQNFEDYIVQCKQLEYDLNDINVLMPANLYYSHSQLTELLNRKKAEEKEKKNAKEMKKFLNRLPKLKKKYTFSDGNLLIRPAEGYEELCAEGTALHHCVYTNYSDKYIKGETDILLIRRLSDPTKPYYTVEYTNNIVIQCRTAYNESATDEVNNFLNKWQAYLKTTNTKLKKEVA